MSENYVISIGRQLGSGGRKIAEQLAEKLNIRVYDRELIQIASKESGLGKEFFENVDEKVNHSILGGLFGMRTSLVDEVYAGYYLSNEMLFNIQSDVIRELSTKESCIFVGRCADYVLKDHPHCLNVFISAHDSDRIRRIAEGQKLNESKAKDFMAKMDKKRAGYYNYFSDKTWGMAGSYHLCINSSVLGIDGTVDLIYQAVLNRFGI